MSAAPVPEGALKSAIRQALQLEPGLVIWNNPSGVADYHGQKVRYGLVVGASDLIGMLTLTDGDDQSGHCDCLAHSSPLARFIALEVKTPAHLRAILSAIARNATAKLGRTDQDQILFLNLVRRHGGFGAWVDSVESARATIARARTGACE